METPTDDCWREVTAVSVLASVWRRLPGRWRKAMLRLRGLRALRRRVITFQYDASYFQNIEVSAARSATVIADSIVRDLRPRTLLDVGCGTGAIMAAVRDRGVRVFGIDSSDAALLYCRERGLDVRKITLDRDRLPAPAEPYDVVLSTEVAEHLPPRSADRFADALASQGSTIVLTAATPGQGGSGHLNEQPHAYWVSKFNARGFRVDEEMTHKWRREWSASLEVASWYAANVIVFRAARTSSAR